MTDYKQMYLKMFSATEDAINLLIATHRECEALYMNEGERQPQAGEQVTEDERT